MPPHVQFDQDTDRSGQSGEDTSYDQSRDEDTLFDGLMEENELDVPQEEASDGMDAEAFIPDPVDEVSGGDRHSAVEEDASSQQEAMDVNDVAEAGNPPGLHQAAARGRKGQRLYVAAYNRILKSQPLGVVGKGGSFEMHGSATFGVDAIAAAISAAAHGLPVPSGWIASAGVEFELTGNGSVSGTDTTGVKSSLTLGLTARVTASALKGLGLSGNLSVGASISLAGAYEGVGHFVAVYLRRFTYLIEYVVKRIHALASSGYKFAKKMLDKYRDAHGDLRVDDDELPVDDDLDEYVENEGDLQEYKNIRALEKKRTTNIKSLSIDAEVQAKAALLLGGGLDASISGHRFTRKRNISGDVVHKGHKWHEMKYGYTLEGSAHLDVGPFKVAASLTTVSGDANPDNDGVYVTAVVKGSVGAIGSLMGGAAELTTITFGATDLLTGTLSATIGTAFAAGTAAVSLTGAVELGTDLILVWYQPGKKHKLTKNITVLRPQKKPARLLYMRTGLNLGLDLGVGGIPLPGGTTLGLGAGGGARIPLGERLGHHSIAYVQTVYLGMKSRQAYKPDDWYEWAARHAEDMQKMMASDNVVKELRGLADTLGQEGADILNDELGPAYVTNDYESWLTAVERLFDQEAGRRRGTGDVSAGFGKFASLGDRRKQSMRWLNEKWAGSGTGLRKVQNALKKNDEGRLGRLRVTGSVMEELDALAYALDAKLKRTGRFPLPEFRRNLREAADFESWKSTVQRIFSDPFAAVELDRIKRG
jgi:hypothetical protein